MFQHISRREFLKLASASGAFGSVRGSAICGAVSAQDTVRPGPINGRILDDFAAGLQGSLLRPGDASYDAARRIWNARFDAHPALIVRCAEAADIKRALEFARAEKLVVAVRGGGHSMAGHSTCDGGMVIDLSPMRHVDVNFERRLVTSAPGLLARDLDRITQEHGLAMVLGGCDSVGIGGFTLGGGEGSLSGKYGLSCDTLLSADVVLADGRTVSASKDDHTDLFWALRGGGGNFGVVTTFHFRAFPLTRVVAGRLICDISQARGVMRGYRAFAPDAPDELTAGLAFTIHDKQPAFVVHAVYAGDEAAAAPTLRALRGLGKFKADTIAPTSYLAFKTASPGPPPGFPSTVRTGFLADLPDDAIDALTDVGAHIPPAAEMELFHLHGAVSRVSLADAAFPLRRPGFDCYAAAAWLTPSQRDAVSGWVQGFWDAIRPHATGAYINMLDGDDQVKSAYGRQYSRLADLKKKYDPDNLFRRNPSLAD